MENPGGTRDARQRARAPLPLPAAPTRLIGRADEVAAACALLVAADVRLLTITGPAGVGKTRLALAVAQALLETGAADVRWVDLTALTHPDAVLPAIATACGVRGHGHSPLLQRLAGLVRGRRLLLVLDNFEHVLGAAAALTPLSATAADLTRLVTSREPLRLRWERRYPLAPLALPELAVQPSPEELAGVPSVALFLDRARAVLPDFAVDDDNVRAVTALCSRLDGLPLAIELVAARLPLFGPQAMLLRLDALLPHLHRAAADAPERHRTIVDAIGWSYQLLDEADQALLRRLAVFVGSWTLEAATVIGCEDEGMLMERVAGLLEKGLLVRADDGAEPRYRLLGVVRAFALERLVADGEAETTGRAHATYYTRLAEGAAPELLGARQATWLNWLERDQDDLRAALQWAAQHDAALELRLAGALWRFWRRAHLRDGRRWLEHALAREVQEAPYARLAALEGAGILAQWAGDLGAARARHIECLHLAERLGEEWSIGRALTNLGTVALRAERFDEARARFTAGLAHCRDNGDTWGAGRALHFLGSVARRTGELAEARERLDGALLLLAEAGALRGLAMALWDQAQLAADLGDQRQALRHLGESLRRCVELGETGLLAYAVAVATWLLADHAEPARLARLLGAVDGLAELLGVFEGPYERRQGSRALAAVQTALGEDQFDGAWAAGRQLPPEKAAEEALVLVEAALNRTRATPPTSSEDWILSAREHEVVRLVTSGLANKEIAAVQHVSLRTVKSQVTAAMTKLHVRNRAQLAAVATERHLV